MGAEAEKVRALLQSEFTPEMQREALAHLWKAYEAAWQTAREFDRAQRRKVYGHHRLALTEQSFKTFCRKYPTWTAADVRPDGGTYDFFVMYSKSLVLTVSRVNAPDRLPAKCDFRDTLAAGTQLSVFDDVTAVDGRKFYHALLLHNYERRVEFDESSGFHRKVRVLARPGFVELVVPERGGTEAIYRTSLFKDHRETVDRLRGVAVEKIPEDGANRPRVRRKDIAETEGA